MEQMPKVLLISYIYPPFGAGGSPRLLRWTRAIAKAGYQPIVLTVKEVFDRANDPGLLQDAQKVARIERTGSLDPKRVLFVLQNALKKNPQVPGSMPPAGSENSNAPVRFWGFLQKLRNWLMVPDDIIGWMPFALWRASRIIRKEKPVLIITSSWPHSVQLIGLVLKKIFGLPWLADFRDNWSRHPYYFFPTRLHRWLNALMEKSVVKNADLITLAYGLEGAQKAYPEHFTKFHRLTNGFNEQDFLSVKPADLTGFNLIHLGSFYGAHGPKHFFSALSELAKKRPEIKSELKVWIIGLFYPEHCDLAKQHHIEDLVQFRNFIPHSQTAAWMFGADALLLFLDSDPKEAAVIPGKVFEYIRAPAWVLAMIPEGETAEILRAAGGALIVPGNQPDKIEAALVQLYDLWKQGKKPERNMGYVMTKEENQLGREMIGLIQSLAGPQK